MQRAGIYTKEIPEDSAHMGIFELRPDLLISWSVIEVVNDGLNMLDMRGNWAVNAEKLSMHLLNDDNEEMYQEHYLWNGSHWYAENDPEIVLNRRNGPKDVRDDLYFDL